MISGKSSLSESESNIYFPSCTGCGFCCLQAPCYVAAKFWYLTRRDGELLGRCPHLYWSEDQNRYLCGLAEEFKRELYIGSGCCSNLNLWRKEIKNRDI